MGKVERVTADTVNGRRVITGHPSTTFADNDTAVSVVSARYPGFKEINGTPYRANHASILCPGIGVIPAFCAPIPGAIGDVLTIIRQAEVSLNVEVK